MLLETESLPWPTAGSTQVEGEELRGEVAIEQYRHDRLRIRVVAPEPGYLVLSNLWYPGWRAWVDDTPTDILPANYALQAVPVAAGEQSVTLRYLPWSFYGPLLLTLGGLVLSAILLGRRAASSVAGLGTVGSARSDPHRLRPAAAVLMGVGTGRAGYRPPYGPPATPLRGPGHKILSIL